MKHFELLENNVNLNESLRWGRTGVELGLELGAELGFLGIICTPMRFLMLLKYFVIIPNASLVVPRDPY